MASFFCFFVTVCCFAFVFSYVFLCIYRYLKKWSYKHCRLLAAIIVCALIIALILISLLADEQRQSLHSFLIKLHSSKDTNTIVSIVSSLITLCLINVIFDSPNWFEFLRNYQLKSNAKTAKSIVQIFIFASAPALFLWQKYVFDFHGLSSLSYTGLFLCYISALLVSVFIIASVSWLFKCQKFRSLFLQPKSVSSTDISFDHCDIDDLIKAEKKHGDNIEASKIVLKEKLQNLSFKNTNNLQ